MLTRLLILAPSFRSHFQSYSQTLAYSPSSLARSCFTPFGVSRDHNFLHCPWISNHQIGTAVHPSLKRSSKRTQHPQRLSSPHRRHPPLPHYHHHRRHHLFFLHLIATALPALQPSLSNNLARPLTTRAANHLHRDPHPPPPLLPAVKTQSFSPGGSEA